MNMLKSAALFLWMFGSSAWLCVCYLRLQKRQAHPKHKTPHKSKYGCKTNQDEKTQLLEEWEDQIWEHTEINE